MEKDDDDDQEEEEEEEREVAMHSEIRENLIFLLLCIDYVRQLSSADKQRRNNLAELFLVKFDTDGDRRQSSTFLFDSKLCHLIYFMFRRCVYIIIIIIIIICQVTSEAITTTNRMS
jgi:hypothetical protein